MALLLISPKARADAWAEAFDAAGRPLIWGEAQVRDPAAITEIACWKPPEDMARYPNLRAVISAGAGVDQMPALPPGVALVRAVAPGIEEMVRDWVVMASLMLHRDMPRYLAQAGAGAWKGHPVAQSATCRVGILGMGRIGRLVAQSLGTLGFPVAGLSRSGQAVARVQIFDASRQPEFLAQTDLLICLAPLTEETRGMIDADFLSHLPVGAKLVQAGRGAQLVLDDLRAALESGRIASAMLDVTDPEPLPETHWAWRDPRVIVTPHIGAETNAQEGARHALDVIAALEAGIDVPGQVDRQRGY
ncbi:glyoxylate/hydroxypyruvate reductase A [Thioclava sp. BHET1]|nr:glyoxylate/hydroxypyruvate reductase A [Thioclava sp. BHET1]